MLAVCLASFVVVQKILRPIAADVEGCLNHIIFENMIISFADVACMRLSFSAAGLFNPGDNPGI